jgi:hypothetical protein
MRLSIAFIFVSLPLSSCALFEVEDTPIEWCNVQPKDQLQLTSTPTNEAELLALLYKGDGRRKSNYKYFWFERPDGDLSLCAVDKDSLRVESGKIVGNSYGRTNFTGKNGVWKIASQTAWVTFY